MSDEFERFVRDVEPGLRRALAGHVRPDALADALGEAFAYAWQHWQQVQQLDNPGGYLFRVAQSRSRSRKSSGLPQPGSAAMPHVEPGLVDAMRALSTQQRSVVWLVHACGWSYTETAEALGISASAVGTYLARGTAVLRSRLRVDVDE